LARWSKVHGKERANIRSDAESLINKAAICGFLAGDGSVKLRKEKSNVHHEIKFFPDDPEMLEYFCGAMKHVYGRIFSIKLRNNFYYVRLTSRTIYEDLIEHSTFGLLDWSLPWKLFKINGAKEAWLRAFFSAEAYVGPKCIKIQTINKKGMGQVSQLLREMEIDHRCYEYLPKNKKHSPVSIIFINKKKSRELFRQKIGFWHSKKSNTLSKTLGLNKKAELKN
jgi:hypothetical protein